MLRRPELSEEKRARYVDAIGETSDRAARLTGQLLAFARRQALTPERFDVGSSLREVLGMVTTLTGSRIVVDLDLPDDPCFIVADRSQFDTSIVNMAVNARDAMGGEGSIRMKVCPSIGIPAIRNHVPVAGDFIAVSLSDSGEGIPVATLDRIFEPFFTTKPVGTGTGLGLSQVIGFAKQSGGDVHVESRFGAGTTFTLYLPRARGPRQADYVDMTQDHQGLAMACACSSSKTTPMSASSPARHCGRWDMGRSLPPTATRRWSGWPRTAVDSTSSSPTSSCRA